MTTQPSLKEIVDGCVPHVREALRIYAFDCNDRRNVTRARIEGYLLAARNSGTLMQDHCQRLLDEIKTTDGYRIIAACFAKPVEPITEGERSLYRWQYKITGGFEKSLWSAILAADSTNLAAIEKGFPEHVAAYHRFGYEAGYWDALVKRINQGSESA